MKVLYLALGLAAAVEGRLRNADATFEDPLHRKLPPSTCAGDGQKAEECGATNGNVKPSCCTDQDLVCDPSGSGVCVLSSGGPATTAAPPGPTTTAPVTNPNCPDGSTVCTCPAGGSCTNDQECPSTTTEVSGTCSRGSRGGLSCDSDLECPKGQDYASCDGAGTIVTPPAEGDCTCPTTCSSDTDCCPGDECDIRPFVSNTCVPTVCSTDDDCNGGGRRGRGLVVETTATPPGSTTAPGPQKCDRTFPGGRCLDGCAATPPADTAAENECCTDWCLQTDVLGDWVMTADDPNYPYSTEGSGNMDTPQCDCIRYAATCPITPWALQYTQSGMTGHTNFCNGMLNLYEPCNEPNTICADGNFTEGPHTVSSFPQTNPNEWVAFNDCALGTLTITGEVDASGTCHCYAEVEHGDGTETGAPYKTEAWNSNCGDNKFFGTGPGSQSYCCMCGTACPTAFE